MTSIFQITSDDDIGAVLDLIRASFAEQDGRIDPPSSMNTLTVEKIAKHLEGEIVWGIADRKRLMACMFGTAQDGSLYLSKLSVHPDARGLGLAGQLFKTAEDYAKTHGYAYLEVIARIELLENHRMFEHLGFDKFAEGRHDGYTRTTEFHYRKPICSAGSP